MKSVKQVCITFAISIVTACGPTAAPKIPLWMVTNNKVAMPKSWLIHKSTINEVAKNTDGWEKSLKLRLQPDDEIWYWEVPHGKFESWAAGYCILRNGQIDYFFVSSTTDIID